MAETSIHHERLAPVLAGPILRRLTPARLTLWLASRAPARLRLELEPTGGPRRVLTLEPGTPALRHVVAGERLHCLLVDLELERPLPTDVVIDYRLALQLADEPAAGWQDHTAWAPDLVYPGRTSPCFVLASRVGALLHGSCRKPHHRSGDGLVAADRLLARHFETKDGPQAARPPWPSLLVLSGDQIYADDVAGSLLRAVHLLGERLGLPNERLDGLEIPELTDARSLRAHPDCYYRREKLLPELKLAGDLFEVLFGGVRKPVFTADSAHNHLITLGEVLAMYLLVWSPAPWEGLEVDEPPGLAPEERTRFTEEREAIREFVAGLPAVRRLFAHVAVAMIFDDHDVTDDWNLNRDWEETAYAHPFSRRVIGNALLAYLLNQGWGNRPEGFDDELIEGVAAALREPGRSGHDGAIDTLLRFEGWDYEWPTEPPLIVLDTRTRRWRSEAAAQRPSGLLDWEAVTDLQQRLRARDSVLLVSAAPIFGVKLIENCQKLLTWFGKPLMVDAEYWLAHRGTANAVLNVFRHRDTPKRFVVLSGDVHYSFVYDVELRGRAGGPDIWQICSSGLRNAFPERLLDVLDRLNRWLYAPPSPLNWLTRRRHMRVVPRKPQGIPSGRRLLNGPGIGLVELRPDGAPWRISELLASGEWVRFVRREEEARWE